MGIYKEKQNNLNIITNNYHAYEIALNLLKKKRYVQAKNGCVMLFNNGHEGAAIKLQGSAKIEMYKQLISYTNVRYELVQNMS